MLAADAEAAAAASVIEAEAMTTVVHLPMTADATSSEVATEEIVCENIEHHLHGIVGTSYDGQEKDIAHNHLDEADEAATMKPTI